jgi:hypothetical protein
MSAARILKFTHRFKSGALCETEIDLEAVRANSFTPHFRWRGTTHKAHEFVCWARDVFRIVANRAGVPVLWCFVHRGSGATETKPGEKPRRIAKAEEPSCNPASAIIIAAAAKFATQSEV